jgi:hypothetical protein
MNQKISISRYFSFIWILALLTLTASVKVNALSLTTEQQGQAQMLASQLGVDSNRFQFPKG